MYCQNSCKNHNYFEWGQYSVTARETVTLAVAATALIGIALIASGFLYQLEATAGVNAMVLIGIGSSLVGVAALAAFSVWRLATYSKMIKQAPAELRATIKQMCCDLVKDNTVKDPLVALHDLAQRITLKDLEAAIRIDYPEAPDTLEGIKGMVGQAKFYMAALHRASPTPLRARLIDCGDTLMTALDSVIAAFGIADFFKPNEGDLHADFKFQKIMMLISLFTLLTATLLPMLGVANSASIVGGVLLGIALLSLIWPKVRPMPVRLPGSENWSKQVMMGQLSVPNGREDSVAEIRTALSQGKHPVLLGPSGVGKTQCVQAFAEAVERGDFPELAGKKVFYFDTATLVASFDMFGKNNKMLERIFEAMGRHKEDCILVFDEIHVAFQEKNKAFGDKLKTYLDKKAENSFPHVIAITTNEEFNRFIFTAEAAIDRRLCNKIFIESTEEEDTLPILENEIVEKAPHVLVDLNALKTIFRSSKGRQPLASKNILSSCIDSVTSLQKTKTVQKIKEVRSELKALNGAGAVSGTAYLKREKRHLAQIKEKEKELARLEERAKEEEQLLTQIKAIQAQLAAVKKAKHEYILEIAKGVSSTSETKVKELLLY